MLGVARGFVKETTLLNLFENLIGTSVAATLTLTWYQRRVKVERALFLTFQVL
jgi:hypothetical protein